MVKKYHNLCIIGLLCMFAFAYGCDQGPDPESLWQSSGHADSTAEAFRHWDEDDPAEVPTSCARCHTETGFLDYLGEDGSASGTVEQAVPVSEDEVISCDACHSDETTGTLRSVSSVTFPSGITIEGLGYEAICMQCHQGRSSTADVNDAIDSMGLDSDDTAGVDLGFINIHYYSAAATQYGNQAQGGYQYEGKSYDAKFVHVQEFDTCIYCHNTHSLEIKTDLCNTCHTDVASKDDLHDIRFNGSLTDYDGDGDISEGIYYEIAGIQGKLYNAIQAYSTEVAGTSIVYDSQTYPYFFIDSNGNGAVDTGEADYGNKYNAFTPRLLKAAYNYQVSAKDPGAFAHGAKYIIQLLYDSLEDLNSAMSSPVSMTGLSRNDEAHFDGSAEAFRHWDEDDPAQVPASCSMCHSPGGLPAFIATGETVDEPISNGLLCTTCHELENGDFSKLREITEVTFPSGMAVDLGDESNLCMVCHQGRLSKASVDAAIAGSDGPYGFENIHYYPAAAVFYGTEVKGGYEYDGNTYAGKKTFAVHGGKYDTCIQCHMGTESDSMNHNVAVLNDCSDCHGSDIEAIRPSGTPDLDADGDSSEALKDEIAGLEESLYAQIQQYASLIGSPIVYDSHTYPYFFNDTNGNGEADEDELTYDNKYSFDAELLKASYNYQTSRKEPHGFIHNYLYIAQLLLDSIEDLGGDVSAHTWR